jgi:hypothetical protein
MPIDQTDLRQTYDEARRLFNEKRYDDLRPLFHEDIIYTKIHSSGWYRGRDEAIAALNEYKAIDNPQFLPYKEEAFAPGGTIRHIAGQAIWERKKGGSHEEIDYIFTFIRDAEGDPWLLIDAVGRILPTQQQNY